MPVALATWVIIIPRDRSSSLTLEREVVILLLLFLILLFFLLLLLCLLSLRLLLLVLNRLDGADNRDAHSILFAHVLVIVRRYSDPDEMGVSILADLFTFYHRQVKIDRAGFSSEQIVNRDADAFFFGCFSQNSLSECSGDLVQIEFDVVIHSKLFND